MFKSLIISKRDCSAINDETVSGIITVSDGLQQEVLALPRVATRRRAPTQQMVL